MTRLRRVPGALAALVVLGALAGGIPGLLVARIGWPLPTAVPSLDAVAAAFRDGGTVSDQTVLKVVACAVWLVWAQFAVAVAAEAAAALQGRRAGRVPAVAGGVQHTARWLVALVVVAASVTHTRAAPASATPLEDVVAPPSAAAAPAVPPVVAPAAAPAAPTWTVERDHTLWAIAEAVLGDGHRWGEVLELNRDRVPDPNLLAVGQVLRLPPGAAAGPPAVPVFHVVAPGDTLSGIAAAALGDADRWGAVWDANQGRPQADGDVLDDPDLIRPGWVLDIPSPTPPVAAAPAAPVVEGDAGPGVVPPPTEVGGGVAVGEPAAAPADPVTAPATDAPAPGSPSSGTAPPSTAAPPPLDAPLVSPTVAGERDAPVTVGLATGGLVTAGVVLLIERRRRAQQRHRRRARRVAMPAPPVVAAERELRAGADVGGAALVDVALRAAAAGTGATGLPALAWVESDGASVLVVLDGPASPPPGFTAAAADRWRTSVPAGELSGLARGSCAPAPMLVPLGCSPGGAEVLVDVETSAVLTVSGPDGAVRGLLAALATAAATSPWAEVPEVLAVGLDAALASLPAVTASSLAEALDRVERRVADAADALAAVGFATTAGARAAGVSPDAWSPLLVVSAEPPDDLAARRLGAVAARAGHGVGVVCAAGRSEPAGRRVDITADGELQVAGLDVAVAAHGLAAVDVAVVADLVEVAGRVDDVAPGPAGEGLRPAPPPPAPAQAPEGRLAALIGELDVLVRVLGPVDVVRPGPDGDEPVKVPGQKELETAVYLALRELPPTREELEAALWPSGTSADRTFHNAVSGTRKLLGAGRDGEPLLAHAAKTGGRYQLSARVASDYSVFHELAAAADETSDAADAATLLAEALTLVRDEPLKGGANGYAWVSADRGIVVAQVVDAADELAEVRLAAGDWRGAEWAARRGLVASPTDERLYRQLALAAFGAGNLAAVRRVRDELFAVVTDSDDGVEPDDTVHPETLAFFDQLLAGRRPAGATAGRHQVG